MNRARDSAPIFMYWEELFDAFPVVPILSLTFVAASIILFAVQLYRGRRARGILSALPVVACLHAIGIAYPSASKEIQIIIFLFGSQILSVVFGDAFPLLAKLKDIHGSANIRIMKFLVEQYGITRSISLLVEIILKKEYIDVPLWLCLINIVITASATISLSLLRKKSDKRHFLLMQCLCFIHAVGYQIFDNKIICSYIDLIPDYGLEGEEQMMVYYRLLSQFALTIGSTVIAFGPISKKKKSKADEGKNQSLIQNVA